MELTPKVNSIFLFLDFTALAEVIWENPCLHWMYNLKTEVNDDKSIFVPHIQGPLNNFFLENALEKTTEYFLNFLFLFESTMLPFNNGK